MEDGLVEQGYEATNSFSISALSSFNQTSNLTPERLGIVFNISPEVALQTLRTTERNCPRNTGDITLNVRRNQDDQIMKYGRSKYDLYTDTAFVSRTRGKKANNVKKNGT